MFKIGQKVVCVEVDKYRLLTKDEIYTITDINHRGSVKVAEIKSDNFDSGYFVNYKFRAIDNAWVDEVLHKIFEEVEQNELVCVGENNY